MHYEIWTDLRTRSSIAIIYFIFPSCNLESSFNLNIYISCELLKPNMRFSFEIFKNVNKHKMWRKKDKNFHTLEKKIGCLVCLLDKANTQRIFGIFLRGYLRWMKTITISKQFLCTPHCVFILLVFINAKTNLDYKNCDRFTKAKSLIRLIRLELVDKLRFNGIMSWSKSYIKIGDD